MIITTFDKNSIDLIRAEVNKRLQSMSEEYGIDLHCGHCSYSSDEMNFKLDVKKTGVDLEKTKFQRNCFLYNLKSTDYHRNFIYENESYVIIGISTSSKKYPIKVKRSDGRGYKFTASLVSKCLSTKVVDIDSML